MKKYTSWSVRFVAVIMMITAFTSNIAFGYEKSLPINSRAALTSEAIRQVRVVTGSLWTQGNLQPTAGSSYFWLEYKTSKPRKDEIRTLVSNQSLSYKVVNPTNDWMQFYMSCRNTDGYELFNGYSGFRLEYGRGGWQVPETARQFDSVLAYTVPMKLKGAIGARIVVRDERGYVTTERGLQVKYDNDKGVGTVFFLSEYAGTRGELVISYWEPQPDGNMRQVDVAYNLSGDGEAIATTDGVTSMKPDFKDIVTLNPPYVYLTFIQAKDHVGVYPLVEVTIPYPQWCFFHAGTIEGEIATAARILKLGSEDAEWKEYPMGPGIPYVPVLLESGVYHVDWVFPKLHPPQPSSSGGGGGSGEKG